MKICEADECDKPLLRAKYCNKHRLRFIRHGDPNYRTKVAKGEWSGVMCSAKDCIREVSVKGICRMHYDRNYRLKQKGIPLSKYSLDE